MSLTTVAAENRRLIVLRTLAEADLTANEDVLRTIVERWGHPEVDKALNRADLKFLSDHDLIELEKLPSTGGEFWIAHLKENGMRVAKGRPHEGVAQRMPGS